MTSTQTTEITFTKLRNGNWGIRGPQEEIEAGFEVWVTKRNGKQTLVTVDRVLWSGDGIALASIVDDRQQRQPQRKRGFRPSGANRGQCTECDAWGPKGHTCQECFGGQHV